MIYKGMEYAIERTALSNELTYQVQIDNTLTSAGDTSTINIELTCTISTTTVGNDHDVYKISFESPVINGHSEGDYEQTEWLFAKLFSINNELLIKTNNQGGIKGIGDKNQIIAAWEIAKADINSIYEKGEVDELIGNMDKALYNDLKNIYHNDTLLNLLFNNIYQTYIGEESIGTNRVIPKHFGATVLPIIEYKELIAIKEDLKIAKIAISGEMSIDELDVEGMNHYLAEVTEMESDTELDYYFDYEGTYSVKMGTESYIDTAELYIDGYCEGYKKQAVYKLKLLGHE